MNISDITNARIIAQAETAALVSYPAINSTWYELIFDNGMKRRFVTCASKTDHLPDEEAMRMTRLAIADGGNVADIMAVMESVA